VKDIESGASGSYPEDLVALGDLCLFTALETASGCELWVSDGTEGGTQLLRDIVPGAGSGLPNALTVLGKTGFVMFSAADEASGMEPWVSDGTPAGTVLVDDIYPGPSSTGPAGYRLCGTRVYLRATSPALGCEPAWLPVSAFSDSPIYADLDNDGFFDELETLSGASPLDAEDTPFGGEAGGAWEDLVVTKRSVKLAFSKPASDSIGLSGTLPVRAGFVPGGAEVVVWFGGAGAVFTLDAKGKAAAGVASKLTVKVKTSGGAVAADGLASFKVKLAKGDFAATLSDEGLADADLSKVPVSVPVVILFNGGIHVADATMTYTGQAGKSGKAK
jgi:ELWxxDGT repeat protein